MTNEVKAVAARSKDVTENTVTVVLSQNLSWVNKAGIQKTFNESQEFTSKTIREINSMNVALFVMVATRQFIKLCRLQGKEGFKMNKPIVMLVTVNGRKLYVKATHQETVSFKFTLSLKRLENMLDKYPELVKTAFAPTPNVGGITAGQVRDYFNGAKSLIFAPAKKALTLPASEDVEYVEAEVIEPKKNALADVPVENA